MNKCKCVYCREKRLRDLLKRNKTGDCWCECGIDNPMVGGKHSALCLEIKKELENHDSQTT
jgi:hypothetical protein